jgi:hypothetical protein
MVGRVQDSHSRRATRSRTEVGCEAVKRYSEAFSHERLTVPMALGNSRVYQGLPSARHFHSMAVSRADSTRGVMA